MGDVLHAVAVAWGYLALCCAAILALALTSGWLRDRWLNRRYRDLRARLDTDLPAVVIVDPVVLLGEQLVYETEAWLREETTP